MCQSRGEVSSRGEGRLLLGALLTALLIVIVLIILTQVGRDASSKDHSLDWRINPNIHTGD